MRTEKEIKEKLNLGLELKEQSLDEAHLDQAKSQEEREILIERIAKSETEIAILRWILGEEN